MQFIMVFLLSLFFFTSYCDQKHTLLGITHGRYQSSIWIQEDVGGECGYSQVYTIVIDTNHKASVVNNYAVGDTAKAIAFVASLNTLSYYELMSKSPGAFSEKKSSFTVTAPKNDERLSEKWSRSFDEPVTWNTQMGDSGITHPVVSGAKIDLLYASPRGFYVGYKIDRVWYSEDMEVIIVFTLQDQVATGMDTMHGFLVYELRK